MISVLHYSAMCSDAVLILCGAIRILVADGEMEGESGSGEDGLQLRLMNTR